MDTSRMRAQVERLREREIHWGEVEDQLNHVSEQIEDTLTELATLIYPHIEDVYSLDSEDRPDIYVIGHVYMTKEEWIQVEDRTRELEEEELLPCK